MRLILFKSFLGIIFLFCSCEKEIEIEIPEESNVLVIEGRIETGQPPYVILTKSAGYFEATGINAFLNSFVHDSKVTVSVDNKVYQLPELCTNDLSPEFSLLAASFLGLSSDQLKNNNYCFYTLPLGDLISGNFLSGIPGKTYKLNVEYEGKEYISYTEIPELVSLDSVWFKPYAADSEFGFAWAHLTDPDTPGNAYRWFAKRINRNSYGNIKDNYFVPPFGSAFDDKFINGKSFDFGYDRGHHPSEEGVELPEEKQHFFKTGDTIVVKFCTIDIKVRNFMRKYESEIWNNGNPFASPSSLPSNIEGGALGLWAGYGASYDTIYALK